MSSYLGYFLIMLGLINASLLVISKPVFSRITSNYDSIIQSTSKLQFPLLLASFVCLILSFLYDDFSLKYVSSNSNSSLPFYYKISATWAGHEGSMLLWCLILSFWMYLASKYSKSLDGRFRNSFLSILGLLNIGFLIFLAFTSNPFERNISIPIDGKDLNPLLQDFGLIIHPPMLYMGYVGLSVVFSFAVACLIHRDFSPELARWIRPWALASWSFLTLGIALGSWWAYYELGWGGWWFWDPVENASFMPWLITTALIHSLITCEQKSMFKNWTIILAILAFSLSVLGTFLVRSGILISVHSFANDPARGIYILLFLAAILGVALYIYFKNSSFMNDNLKFKLLSRESFFLINNILLVTATFTILLGTIYPLILDLLGLEKISIGTPYYNAVFLPIMTPAIILAGYVPLMLYLKNKRNFELLKHIYLSVGIILLFTLPSIYFLDEYNMLVLLGIFIFVWVICNLIYYIYKMYKESKNMNLLKNKLGMIFSHIGLAVFVLGATVVESNNLEQELVMSPGQVVKLKNYQFKLNQLSEYEGPNYTSVKADFVIYRNDEIIAEVFPEKRLYNSSEMPMTEAGIAPKINGDLYITLGNLISENKWSVRIYFKPMVRLIWLGAILMFIGGIISILTRKQLILSTK
ncbi:MAG: c-type cytochrome biogenesis protein CcmF [Gammaproteobacteria bacterium]|nr:MAG: c-type cytochrome biogenesis protein CcmF [Gammaproteobacteria bacterium]|tara:strand:+ start:2573 stop:4492 length:1920 start_codon:yes stop_codon:yes gene_type:complete